jgi:hypothetical protein
LEAEKLKGMAKVTVTVTVTVKEMWKKRTEQMSVKVY